MRLLRSAQPSTESCLAPHMKKCVVGPGKRAETKQQLKRRLQLWKNGDINDLLSEGVSLQNRLQNTSKTKIAEKQNVFGSGDKQRVVM